MAPLDPVPLYRADTYQSEDSVGYLMRRVVFSLSQAIDKRLAPHGLTHAQWGPLFLVYSGRGSTVAELARCLQTDPGAMTRLLDRLEAKGLCRRERCTNDRRVVRLVLTTDGEQAAGRVPAALVEVLNAHLAGFSVSEWQALKGYLNRMLANGQALREACDGHPDAAAQPPEDSGPGQ